MFDWIKAIYDPQMTDQIRRSQGLQAVALKSIQI